jgi:hypothetical protein
MRQQPRAIMQWASERMQQQNLRFQSWQTQDLDML